MLAETEGNPFFIEEVLRDLLESGADDDAIRVPESVREVIGRRVERLSAGALDALEAAAAYGREFDVGVLAAAAPEQRDALLDGLDEAERAQLVRPLTTGTARGMGAGRWAFSHALVRDAIYDELPTLRRARLHAAIADALVRGGGATAEAAHHAYEAAALDGGERAVALSREAAAEALAGLDYEAAAAHTAHALQALELDPAAGPHDRAAVLIEHGDALARAGDPGAVAAFAEARDLAAGAPELVARAALGACGVGVTIIDVDLDRAAWLEAAAEQLGDGHPGLRARLLARLAIELAYAGRPARRTQRGGGRRRPRGRRSRRPARRAQRPPCRALAPGRARRAAHRRRRDDRARRRPRSPRGRAAGPQLARRRPVGAR